MLSEEKKEHISTRLRKSILLYIKEKLEFIDVKIMSHVLVVVMMVAIIAATVAWFQSSAFAKVSGLHFMTAGTDDVEISIAKDSWENILCDSKTEDGEHEFADSVSPGAIDISMPAFQNIYDRNGNRITAENSGILAPGTYGSFSFYVKLVNDKYNICELSVSRVLDTAVTQDSLKAELVRLFSGHILCFARVEGETSCRFVSRETPVEISFGEFQGESEAKEVVIYWVWPYEYKNLAADTFAINDSLSVGSVGEPAKIFTLSSDLPDTLSETSGKLPAEGSELSMNQVFEWKRYQDTLAEYRVADSVTREKMLSDWYDYGDTLIGSYVNQMVFHIQARGAVANESE